MLSNEYIAGLFDGEGCISITAGHFIRISITNCNQEVLELVQQTLGYGKVRLKSSKSKCYDFRIDNRVDIKRFLQAVSPFLIVKKEKAKEASHILETFPYRYKPSCLLDLSMVQSLHRTKSLKEIASITGFSRTTVWQKLHSHPISGMI